MTSKAVSKNWRIRGPIIVLTLVAAVALVIYSVHIKNKAYYRLGGRDATVEETVEIFSDNYDRQIVEIRERAEVALRKKNALLSGLYLGVFVLIVGGIVALVLPVQISREHDSLNRLGVEDESNRE